MMDEFELIKEKRGLTGTIYHDFISTINKNSIYKSIILTRIKDGTAFYECEPYDDAYRVGNHFFETCEKIERAFKKYYKRIFDKYGVNNILVEIYDEWACNAGLSVYADGRIETGNF